MNQKQGQHPGFYLATQVTESIVFLKILEALKGYREHMVVLKGQGSKVNEITAKTR